MTPTDLSLLNHPTRHLFFTGKGGVGKTSLSTAVALHLADAGKRVLLVSTDAASNLDEMLGIVLKNTPVPVPDAPNLSVLNIDPDTAAESYRQRVVAQMAADSSDAELSTVREQLSGACTTEIASFDEFASLLADADNHYDHIVFDTAPTGHTLRLLSLPKAWSGFLASNDRGASCLGPHSGLKMQEVRFKAALDALSDPGKTTVVLVTRPDAGAIAVAIEALGAQALAAMPANLLALPDFAAGGRAGRSGRRVGPGRQGADHGHGQGWRRQDHHCRGPGDWPGAAWQDRASEHYRPRRPLGGHTGWCGGRLACGSTA